MGVLVRGVTFTRSSTLTAANLEQLLTGASVSGLRRQNVLLSEHRPITADSSPPSGLVEGEPWVDTDTGLVKVYNGTTSVAAYGDSILAYARSGNTIPANTAVGLTSTGSVYRIREVTSGTQANFLGVTLEEITDTAPGFVRHTGIVTVLVTGAVAAGAFLVASATAGTLEGAGQTLDSLADDNAAYAIAMEDRVGGASTIRAWIIQ